MTDTTSGMYLCQQKKPVGELGTFVDVCLAFGPKKNEWMNSCFSELLSQGNVSEFWFRGAQEGRGCKLHSSTEPAKQGLNTFEVFGFDCEYGNTQGHLQIKNKHTVLNSPKCIIW